MNSATTPLVPSSFEEALQWLEPIRHQSSKQLQRLGAPDSPATRAVIARAWSAVAYAIPSLHPDNGNLLAWLLINQPAALSVEEWIDILNTQIFNSIGYCEDPKCPPWLRPCEEESGWPIALIPLYDAAWQLYQKDLLTDEEFYNNDAQRAGLGFTEEPPNPGVARPSDLMALTSLAAETPPSTLSPQSPPVNEDPAKLDHLAALIATELLAGGTLLRIIDGKRQDHHAGTWHKSNLAQKVSTLLHEHIQLIK